MYGLREPLLGSDLRRDLFEEATQPYTPTHRSHPVTLSQT
jgi:hypothetical protein